MRPMRERYNFSGVISRKPCILIAMKTFEIFYRDDNARAATWAKKIGTWLKGKKARIGSRPDFVIVLRGDGATLEAARKYQKQNPVIIGLNLCQVGFLASVRAEK